MVPDSGGRAATVGAALERHLRFRTDNATLQIRSDRRDHPCYGLQGGHAGAPSGVSIVRASGQVEASPAKFLTTVHAGDVLKVRLAGGGGHGQPLLREPSAVLEDVREEKMTLAHAREQYGVVIGGNPLAVDADATAELRRA